MVDALRKSDANYNFSALEERKLKQPPQLRVVEKRTTNSQAVQQHIFTVSIAFAAVAMILFLIIYNNVVLTEIGDQINDYSAQYEVLKSENSRMQVELEGKISLRKVEEYATGVLGMAKMEPYQIEYIDMGGKDKIELSSTKNNGVFEKIKAAFCSFWNT